MHGQKENKTHIYHEHILRWIQSLHIVFRLNWDASWKQLQLCTCHGNSPGWALVPPTILYWCVVTGVLSPHWPQERKKRIMTLYTCTSIYSSAKILIILVIMSCSTRNLTQDGDDLGTYLQATLYDFHRQAQTRWNWQS